MGWLTGMNGRDGLPADKASRKIIERHRREEAAEKAARQRRKAEDRQYGRRGRGIVCGWGNEDDGHVATTFLGFRVR